VAAAAAAAAIVVAAHGNSPRSSTPATRQVSRVLPRTPTPTGWTRLARSSPCICSRL